ncbi:MAP kinase [Cystobasidium minutum MCA 4210]|uniref:MAP kinase n=1 Tax=Cystobasidium minutum MCA 4210 TaxID=1397322 RepID=UPI0034CF3AD4|eukprot:jgi/Rhomi1/140848/e_gw1.2.1133.1
MGANGASTEGDSAASSSTPGGATPNGTGINGRAGRPQMKLPGSGSGSNSMGGGTGTPFSNFSKIVDPSGSLNFQNKAVLHAKGVDFSTGASFNINMDELELQDELGSGNYGTVQKVYHKITKVTMAMKEIRLELDDSKLKGIITELDVLHRATAPEIVEFYGAFFIESCVYYCMEYMDAGSLDKMSVIPVPEPVLQRVTASMVRGLKFLKDKLQIMHRDVKPTNVLINTAGMVKLCDFGVSGQLERSLAKTNIGCQSYMAPERIKGESQNFLGTYTVSSDVWSLGLSIVEFTLGRYPYPPETYSNVFAQLTAIVHGDPPCLPDGYSKAADDFVAACLQKDANKRPSYAQLLRHPFLATEAEQDTDMVGWVKAAMEKRASMRNPPSSSAPTAPVKNT